MDNREIGNWVAKLGFTGFPSKFNFKKFEKLDVVMRYLMEHVGSRDEVLAFRSEILASIENNERLKRRRRRQELQREILRKKAQIVNLRVEMSKRQEDLSLICRANDADVVETSELGLKCFLVDRRRIQLSLILDSMNKNLHIFNQTNLKIQQFRWFVEENKQNIWLDEQKTMSNRRNHQISVNCQVKNAIVQVQQELVSCFQRFRQNQVDFDCESRKFHESKRKYVEDFISSEMLIVTEDFVESFRFFIENDLTLNGRREVLRYLEKFSKNDSIFKENQNLNRQYSKVAEKRKCLVAVLNDVKRRKGELKSCLNEINKYLSQISSICLPVKSTLNQFGEFCVSTKLNVQLVDEFSILQNARIVVDVFGRSNEILFRFPRNIQQMLVILANSVLKKKVEFYDDLREKTKSCAETFGELRLSKNPLNKDLFDDISKFSLFCDQIGQTRFRDINWMLDPILASTLKKLEALRLDVERVEVFLTKIN